MLLNSENRTTYMPNSVALRFWLQNRKYYIMHAYPFQVAITEKLASKELYVVYYSRVDRTVIDGDIHGGFAMMATPHDSFHLSVPRGRASPIHPQRTSSDSRIPLAPGTGLPVCIIGTRKYPRKNGTPAYAHLSSSSSLTLGHRIITAATAASLGWHSIRFADFCNLTE